jgi:hypothetical protein
MDDISIITGVQLEGLSFFDNCYKKDPDPKLLVSYQQLYLDGELTGTDTTHDFLNYLIATKDTLVWKTFVAHINTDKYLLKYLDNAHSLDLIEKLLIPEAVKFLDNYEFENILDNLQLQDTDIPLTRIINLIKISIKNKKVKTRFVNWVAEVYNENVVHLNFEHEIASQVPLLNILRILLSLWQVGAESKTMNSIDWSYLTLKSCPIKWYTRSQEDKSIPFSTQLTFLIIAYLRVTFVPVLKRKDVLLKQLNDLNNRLLDEKNIFYNMQIKQLTAFSNIYQEDCTMLETKEIKLVDNFVENFANTLLKATNEITLDDILAIICDYYKYNTKSINKILAIKIISDKNFCKNLTTRFTCLHLMNTPTEELVDAVINLNNDMLKAQHDKSYYVRKELIFSILEKTDKYTMLSVLQRDKYRTHKFASTLVNDINEIVDILCEIFESDQIPLSELIMISKQILTYMTSMVDSTRNLLSYPEIVEVLTADETCIKLAITLSVYIKFCWKNPDSPPPPQLVKPAQQLMILCSVISKRNPKLVQEIISHDDYKYTNYEHMTTNNTLIKQFLEKLKTTTKVEDTTVVPDELLDPLTYTLIKDPVMLPNSDVFLDKTTINMQLANKEENPFNREPLTLKQLDEYNKTPEVVEKLNKFKAQLEKFNKKI